ncbi:iron ABC transporter [Gallibacterium salpingitidis]|uniref:Iron ABC transporter n=1 Tax=Gallibacterium salpingitidis TaxID=505341 RepID=A0A1A7Q8P3_9PAST|nr:Fe(3+) dicitrate ABC transporter ATP-binding protein FecE [Gallibacterium salpingitidis]OBW91877.1 iron ABC transporter [Gallibacterium salpingitidis]OBX09795.1 iron ABC transporter [Gallibacterium salpingitidis]OBX11320.1 iron ABC transporter [Gallibacterium salpingitidis]WKS99243.1 Fe(3+) dicitrate ABC transporter ATP-binding protein FecE [Gallibacterium salpingitidis]
MQLSTHQLTVGYGKKIILNKLNVNFPDNQITALIGPNGCGKSTLLKSIARLIPIKQGEVLLNNKNIWHYSANQFAQQLALLPQHHITPEGINVRSLISYGRSPYLNLWGKLKAEDKEKIEEAMEITQVTSLANNLVTDLSGGQKQRVFLAMALAQDSPFLLLDEPTTYLDLNHQTELMNIMQSQKAKGKTIITVLHDLNQASRYCDHLVVLKQGTLIAEGAPETVMTKDLLNKVFSLHGEIHQDPISHTPMFISY